MLSEKAYLHVDQIMKGLEGMYILQTNISRTRINEGLIIIF